MYTAFVTLLNMSAAAAILIAVVIAVRFLLWKTPKKYICILWALVGLRLLCPSSISSALSAYNYIGSMPQGSGQIEYVQYNSNSEKPMGELPVFVPESSAVQSTSDAEHKPDFYLPTVMLLWAVGAAAMLTYAVFSFIGVRLQIRQSIPLDRQNHRCDLFICDDIPSPFILGVLRPKIYLPSSLNAMQQDSVVAHERAHLVRLDHLWKPLGFFLLSLHWFNPMVWIAYAFLCRDIEMACDEKVIAKMSPVEKQAYSAVLLTCSMPRKRISACPLAFGEAGVKERIRGILNYRKPTVWIVFASGFLCMVLAIGFLSNPLRTEDYLQFKGSEIKPNQPCSFDFGLQAGKTVHGPVITAELWQNGDLVRKKQCVLADSVKNMNVSMSATQDGDSVLFYRVQVGTNPYTADLDVTFPMPEETYLVESYPWHGAKDIPLTADKQILLAASVFACGSRDFFLFDFDNEKYGEAGNSLRNQDCVVLVRAAFEEIILPEKSNDQYWEALRQAGLIYEENGEELFYEAVRPEEMGEMTQEQLDEYNGMTYQSARLQEDGSAVYKMNREQYERTLTEITQRLESICQGIPHFVAGSNLRSVAHTSDFSEFTVTLRNGSVIDFDADAVSDYLRFFARRYRYYTTGKADSPITVYYRDMNGDPSQYPTPSYQLRIGTEGVRSITVYRNSGSLYSYSNTLGMPYTVGSIKQLHWLNGVEDLTDVQILARDAEDRVLWRYTFAGNEAFPFSYSGWMIEKQ